MIGRLQGVLLEASPPDVLLDVQGVGYELQVPLSTFYALPAEGQVCLYTHLSIREDAHQLYGFASQQERELFRTLIKVNGVGPKLGLAILSGMDSQEFIRVVQRDDLTSLQRLPGIGKKTAERLLIEMRDKLAHWGTTQAETVTVPAGHATGSRALEEAESALVALGYKPKEANRAVAAVAEDGMSSQELIRLALKAMVKV